MTSIAPSRLAALVCALSLVVAGCDCAGGTVRECPVDLVLEGEGMLAQCVPRCMLEPTDARFEGCPSGAMCGLQGCYTECGASSCSLREMCDPATMTCVRRLDGGTGDAGTGDAGAGDAGPGDAGAADAGVGDAGTSDAGAGDAGTSDAGGAELDSGTMMSTSCALGLATSGTRIDVGSGSGFAINLRLAAAHGQVAWADGNQLQLADSAGTAVRAIARASVQDIALSPTHLYWSEGIGPSSVYRVPLAELGTTAPTLLATATYGTPQIAVSADALYWVESDGPSITVRRAMLDGTMPRARGTATTALTETLTDLAIAGDHVYASLRNSFGATGCFRVLRWDAGAPPDVLPGAAVIYGPTASACSSTTYNGFAVEGATLWFHSSSPPELVEYSAAAGMRRVASGFGDGSDLGITSSCIVAAASGLQGVPRAGGMSMPYAMGTGISGRLAVDGPFAYGFVTRGSLYGVVRVGL